MKAVANLPPVLTITTPVVLVAKFTAGVIDNGGKFAIGLVDTGVLISVVVHLDLQIYPQIFKKI